MLPYWMSFSLRILADSWNSSSSIQEGTSQCSFGINSRIQCQLCYLKKGESGLTIFTLCFRLCLCPSLKFFIEGDIVEKGPWVVEFRIPGSFEISHRLNHSIDFVVSN